MKLKRLGDIRFIPLRDANAVGRQAAEMVADQLMRKPASTLIFPTGNTPLPMYAALRHLPKLHWQSARLFHLDEYVRPAGVKSPPYETYEEYMRRELWDYIDAEKHFFSEFDRDPGRYEALINRKGPPDLVILGIGSNGHIAFNEPGSAVDSPARVIDLADKTLVSNFGSVGKKGYPTQAVTLGLKTILSARKIILLATKGKEDIIRRALDPATPPDLAIPASLLKRVASRVTLITDFDL